MGEGGETKAEAPTVEASASIKTKDDKKANEEVKEDEGKTTGMGKDETKTTAKADPPKATGKKDDNTSEGQDTPNPKDDDKPIAVQIVSIGTESNAYAFTFHEERLNSVMSRIPPGWKVSVVSVVGAFRTGKSFLLSWFLRYLHYHSTTNAKGGGDTGGDWEKVPALVKHGEKWYQQFHTLGNDGFDWRGGSDRNTTGIWMWSEPYFLKRPGGQHDLAVVLVDTQGMFDHETTMGLTAAIFGLSTLLSSYQIYNVDKRIQEDNLQQLALFSEYGRMALKSDGQKAEEEDDTKKGKGTKQKRPFQRIEFLVRDWQNFEDDEDMALMEQEMEKYLSTVIAERDAKDLQDTREQITSCFDEVSCFMMTHPGFAVTKKKYNGDVGVIEPTFLTLLDRYCHRVFGSSGVGGNGSDGTSLSPKIIHGRELTAAELGAYVKAYAKMFESGAKFPKAETMLEATASANNANATNLSATSYREALDKVAGPHCSSYLKPEDLLEIHERVMTECLKKFDSIANFGSTRAIEEARRKLIVEIKESYVVYEKLNDGRNPLAGFETFIIPMGIAVVAFVLRWIADTTCSGWSQTCRAGSDMLSQIFAVVFIFLLIVASTKAKQISELISKLKAAFGAVNAASGGSGGGGTQKKRVKVD